MEAEPDRSRGWYCEVREIEFSPGDINGIDAGPNGGIEVTGWGDNSVLVLARVQGKARSDGDARDLVEEVRIESGGITLRARGPRTQRRESWSVSYRVSVPHRYDLDLSTVNGGISVTDVNGHIEFSATNGGVSLVEVGGDVRGRTTNGGLKIQLSGDRWDGEGLDVRTTNGGITMILPEEFNAQLESGTTHGGISIDFPVTVSGRIERRLITQLGSGGPLVRAITTNGGVRITKR
ncbi:MAG: DUF4097 family beta strand repeat-containing protein [Myxococcota bacterium]|nr:DUF4097 family beta strand repeat-containing protein [Myxococcota bacterium]